MVDALTSKTIAWEKEKGIKFTFDGVSTLSNIPASLIMIFLDFFNLLVSFSWFLK